MRYLVLDDEGFVVNVIVWDGVSKLPKRNKHVMLESDGPIGVATGWKYADGQWIEPNNPTEETTEEA